MQKHSMSGIVVGFVGLVSAGVLAQSWTLPPGKAVVDKGPRTYRFTVDHTVTDTTGQVVQRQRVSGDYTRGLLESLPRIGERRERLQVLQRNPAWRDGPAIVHPR